ncbi:BTB/POZ and MATH domain-containing protein 1-like [Panicum virgatum]|uniref:BTB/POZ and MATH domain-containing protein 1-like n=1 Tax=Panicum virgatum TaxID=38727 RepID=UPI0019D5BC41|nr:BTB/POZ and MATH domain-containing protein 1-like [Panicum virgatum]
MCCWAADAQRWADTRSHARAEVVGGVLHRGFGVGNFVRSAPFAAGGHQWYIRYYPDGYTQDTMDYVSVFLEIMSKSNEASVHFNFRQVHQDTGRSVSVSSLHKVFNENTYWGLPKFRKKSDLVAQGYLKDDCLEIECDLTVIKVGEIDVTPLLQNVGDLLESKVGVDVTFKVKEEAFHAHRIVLAARSPVLKAELYGPLSDKGKRSIVVEDMAPRVFNTLLHFVYKDCLPAMDDLDGSEYEEMGKHLLVAADRYGMERMKLVCESILCNRLSVETVAATLVLADQHHCAKLKDACIRFIDSSNRMDDVAASQGYESLKRACPVLTAELWEKSAKSRKL